MKDAEELAIKQGILTVWKHMGMAFLKQSAPCHLNILLLKANRNDGPVKETPAPLSRTVRVTCNTSPAAGIAAAPVPVPAQLTARNATQNLHKIPSTSCLQSRQLRG